MIGAHLAAVLESGGYRAYDAARIDAWTGRSAIFGGIFAAVAVAPVVARVRRIPLARSSTAARRPVHPTQLYAAVFAFVLTAVLIYVLRRRRHADGRVFALFLLAYATWRFLLVYLRADSGTPLVLGLYPSQLWSVAAAGVALAITAYSRRAASAAPRSRIGITTA